MRKSGSQKTALEIVGALILKQALSCADSLYAFFLRGESEVCFVAAPLDPWRENGAT